MGWHFYFLEDHTNPLSQFWEESWHNREAFTESLMGFGGGGQRSCLTSQPKAS